MRTPGVVRFDPHSDGGASFGEAAEIMLPYALFFKAAKKAFDETVLLGIMLPLEIEPPIVQGRMTDEVANGR